MNTKKITSHILGYPRIGEKRELKKNTEKYWKGELSKAAFLETVKTLRMKNWQQQKQARLSLLTVGDFSLYDHMLDLSLLFGIVPARFKSLSEAVDLELLFAMARGGTEKGQVACEMTKWFDTNYHYLVPELDGIETVTLSTNRLFEEIAQAKILNMPLKVVLVGPVTYVKLAKFFHSPDTSAAKLAFLDKLVPAYESLLTKLAEQGVEWVQFDEPVFSLDLTREEKNAFTTVYTRLAKAAETRPPKNESNPSTKLKLMVANYFGELRDNLSTFLSLPVAALHQDFVRGGGEFQELLNQFPADKLLSLGVVDGRNIWKNNFSNSLALLKAAAQQLERRFMISASCSLLHVPLSLAEERKLDDEVKNWLSFCHEKLQEINFLSSYFDEVNNPVASKEWERQLEENEAAHRARKASSRIQVAFVKRAVSAIKESDYQRKSPFKEREALQKNKYQFPPLPTTTVGSFPQTKEVRKKRAAFRKGTLSKAEYEAFVKKEIAATVAFQEESGLDVLVHGEFERNDMVEYFGEQLNGFCFTQFGWVQSYGTRCVKPPIIYGDISRPASMTVQWSQYAQRLTKKPMKGMLTGPVTILRWSFVRDDQPPKDTAEQIALALNQEVLDLEAAGITIIQIDEPAFREGMPLRKADEEEYLNWAVRAFKLSCRGVKNATQIHTHMCYSDFNQIIAAIAAMDADVISMETSRSQMELLSAFRDFNYPNQIGPGVYDIHSPRIPEREEMVSLLKKAEQVLRKESLWVNPDCGLKTRGWDEVKPALRNMVAAAQALRPKPL